MLYFWLFSIHRIFGYSGDEAQDIIYINWLSMARAGLLALEFFSPDTKSWRQVLYIYLPVQLLVCALYVRRIFSKCRSKLAQVFMLDLFSSSYSKSVCCSVVIATLAKYHQDIYLALSCS